MKYALFLLCLVCSFLQAVDPPVAYKGRFRPLDVYIKLWIKEHPSQSLWQEHLKEANADPRLPLHAQLRSSGTLLVMLPGRYNGGEWFPLKALKLQVKGEPVGNFTLYPDAVFRKLQLLYAEGKQEELFQELASTYPLIAGNRYQEGTTSALYYPSLTQLQAESFYESAPWILWISLVYLTALLCFLSGSNRLAIVMALGAFLLHTALIALRCYILGRPPVSNMFETMLYVPWVAVLLGFALSVYFRSCLALAAASLLTAFLFILLPLTGMENSLDNVQAVLNSRYWLIVHVLLVVGSYGIFLLGGILAHFYLIGLTRNKEETITQQKLAALLLQSTYWGVALLIPGTLLGGVWAAESWGRFWDWDPKEAWAFISICVYLILIHAYTFKHIGNFGLAVGSIVGIQAILFTWYGVNYILGTGLHSYGFGQGGELFYSLFLGAECLFLLWIIYHRRLVLE